MTKITAGEARQISGTSSAEYVEAVYPLIRAAAAEHKRQVNLHSEFWVREGYSGTQKYKDACKILEQDGYVVRFFYEDCIQFTNMYTVVKW